MMKDYLRAVGYGCISWVIPFFVSFPFFDMKTQQLKIDEMFFKSIMIIVGAIVGCALLVRFFKLLEKDFIKMGIIAGLIIMVINLVLDYVILIPMSSMDIMEYYTQIGLRYWIIPVFSVSMGVVLQK